ncbi:DUF3050 domain-containing protein [Planctomicrobium sp. SH668]|uniref:DUF3050 domain-containing protein n=1 Tax=Planctomicrobium sp. SH668 TaxID=3448126 RepID=UPI003F5B0C64
MTDSDSIQKQIQPFIDKLLAHPLYEHVHTVSRLRIFMREHAFAVWDFMTLLKRLQQDICGTRLPWAPPVQPNLARFVNEIVLGEESDTHLQGGFTSHYELYVGAMDQLGADTQPIRSLVQSVRAGEHVEAELETLPIRDETKAFVKFNLRMAGMGSPWEVAALFCFGREDIIPEMFDRLLQPISNEDLGAELFAYYLQRHIDLDGNEHGPLSRRLLATLIDGNELRMAEAVAAGQQAIENRIKLWDGILHEIQTTEEKS